MNRRNNALLFLVSCIESPFEGANRFVVRLNSGVGQLCTATRIGCLRRGLVLE